MTSAFLMMCGLSPPLYLRMQDDPPPKDPHIVVLFKASFPISFLVFCNFFSYGIAGLNLTHYYGFNGFLVASVYFFAGINFCLALVSWGVLFNGSFSFSFYSP